MLYTARCLVGHPRINFQCSHLSQFAFNTSVCTNASRCILFFIDLSLCCPCLCRQGSIFESNAVARYVARMRRDTELYGVSFFESAQVSMSTLRLVHARGKRQTTNGIGMKLGDAPLYYETAKESCDFRRQNCGCFSYVATLAVLCTHQYSNVQGVQFVEHIPGLAENTCCKEVRCYFSGPGKLVE